MNRLSQVLVTGRGKELDAVGDLVNCPRRSWKNGSLERFWENDADYRQRLFQNKTIALVMLATSPMLPEGVTYPSEYVWGDDIGNSA